MSEQDGTQASTLQRPVNDDQEAWESYWKAQSQEWRTEPEIDAERQKYLDERRSIEPDTEEGIYPFMNIKLSRADVEWLLVTHENGRGPIDWSDESQREREGLDLRGADLRNIDLRALPLAGTIGAAIGANRARAEIIHLEGAHLDGVHLEGAHLSEVCLENARLNYAHLERAYLYAAHLENAHLNHAHLEGASLVASFFDSLTDLERVVLDTKEYGGFFIADIHWGDVNVAVVDWSSLSILGDELYAARKQQRMYYYDGKLQVSELYLVECRAAVRAYRQLAVVLRNQGLNEDAARFAYRAQLMQRKVFWYQGKFAQHLGSLFLDLLAGYGYKPWRSFLAYLLVITAFATAYFIIGHTVGPVLSPLGSFVFSMTSFHGRGFFPGGITLDDPLTVVAAFEAFIGLLIEVTFIATLTQRLFGK